MGDDARIGEVLGGTWKIVRLLGKGGMGEVYEAKHVRLPKRFAVKFLQTEVLRDPLVLDRFRREAEIGAGIDSEHVVDVIDTNTTPSGTPYIVMEFLEGEELAKRITHVGQMKPAEALVILDQIAQAVHAAHTHQDAVVHRDLKPQNVFLIRKGTRDDFVKVLDFGIAKVRSASVATQTGSRLGTPNYMAPEQVSGKVHDIDGRTDVFALGAIAYEMLTGRRAFDATNPLTLAMQIMEVEPRPLVEVRAELDPAVALVIQKAMAKRREDRFGSMAEMGEALRTAFSKPIGDAVRIGQELAGYRFVRFLGAGECGDVYEAENLAKSTRHALKLLRSDALADPHIWLRFRTEAAIGMECGDAHIATIDDLGTDPSGTPYLVMELLNGENLRQRMARVGRLPLDDAWVVLARTAKALEAAHERGVVHGNLKPHNVFLIRAGHRDDFLKLLDFGIRRIAIPSVWASGAGRVTPTRNYTAPEQFRGEEVDARTDVFALGAIAYELLSGRKAFDAPFPAVRDEICDRSPPPFLEACPELGSEVAAIVHKAMATRPADRFVSVADLREALRNALGKADEAFMAVGAPVETVRTAHTIPSLQTMDSSAPAKSAGVVVADAPTDLAAIAPPSTTADLGGAAPPPAPPAPAPDSYARGALPTVGGERMRNRRKYGAYVAVATILSVVGGFLAFRAWPPDPEEPSEESATVEAAVGAPTSNAPTVVVPPASPPFTPAAPAPPLPSISGDVDVSGSTSGAETRPEAPADSERKRRRSKSPRGKSGRGVRSRPDTADSAHESEAPFDDLTTEAEPPLPESLTDEMIVRVMSALGRKAQSCYREEDGVGFVELAFEVRPSGLVPSVDVRGSFRGKPSGECVAALVRAARFPKVNSIASRAVQYPVRIAKPLPIPPTKPQ